MAPESLTSRVVRQLTTTMVQPASPTPTVTIWLSNLDVGAGPRSFVPTIYLFRRPDGIESKDFFSLETLKASLALTLVKFYPCAGKLALGDGGRMELQCTGEGVKMVVAECESGMDEFGDFAPSMELRKKLCPFPEPAHQQLACPAYMFQVTYFRCGGVCLGTAGHHMVCDGMSSLYFINSWAEITRGVNPDTIAPPQLDRTVLSARDPPLVEYPHDQYRRPCFKDMQSLPAPSTFTRPAPPVSTAMLRISKDQVTKLKGGPSAAAAAFPRPVSTFTAVVAHVWRCMCKARALEGNEPTRLLISADIRNRLVPPLPYEFLGNAILFMPADTVVGDLLSSSLESVAKIINKSKENLHDRYLRSLIDFLEQQEGPMLGPSALSATDLFAVSWLQLPLYETDFGWGKPAFMGRAELPYPGRIYIQRSPEGDGAVLVTVAVEESLMAEFQKHFYLDM